MRQFGRLEQASFFYEREPVRDVVMNRALPFTVRVSAGQAAACLRSCIRAVIVPVNLAEMLYANFGGFLVRITPWHFQKLQWMFCHYAARRSDSMSEPSSLALGLIIQNLGKKVR